MDIRYDLTGQRFGRLVALKVVGVNKYRRAIWLCECDCGETVEVARPNLIRQDGKGTRSCGCLWKEAVTASNVTNKTVHGLYGSKIHTVWKDMLYRCEKPQNIGYKNYGGRGIRVCEEWHDLSKFAEWAYANGYDDMAARGDCTIERIDVNGNYEPSNCKFVNMFAQNANRRNTLKIDIDGECVPLMLAVKKEGLDYKPVYDRMRYYGESFDSAVKRMRKAEHKRK